MNVNEILSALSNFGTSILILFISLSSGARIIIPKNIATIEGKAILSKKTTLL